MTAYQKKSIPVLEATKLIAEGEHAIRTGGNLTAIKAKIEPAISALKKCKDPQTNSKIKELEALRNQLQ